MSRYVTRPRLCDCDREEDDAFRPETMVDDYKIVDTGLVSARGDPIYRVPSPIGFGREHE